LPNSGRGTDFISPTESRVHCDRNAHQHKENPSYSPAESVLYIQRRRNAKTKGLCRGDRDPHTRSTDPNLSCLRYSSPICPFLIYSHGTRQMSISRSRGSLRE
jgi:hypothetical protein